MAVAVVDLQEADQEAVSSAVVVGVDYIHGKSKDLGLIAVDQKAKPQLQLNAQETMQQQKAYSYQGSTTQTRSFGRNQSLTDRGGAYDRQSRAAISGGRGGGVKGARTLTEREEQVATFAQLGQTYNLDPNAPRRGITGQRLSDLGLQAQQTTLGTTLSPSGFGLTRGVLGLFGEEQSIKAETFLGATEAQQDTIAAGLDRGSLRATAPTARTPLERSPAGTLAAVATGAFQGQRAVAGLAGATRAAALAGTTAGLVAAAPAVAAGIGAIGTFKSLLDEEGLRGSFLPARTDTTRAPARTRTGGGEGGRGTTQTIAAATPTTPTTPTRPTPPADDLLLPPRRAMGSGLASTVRTSYFGAVAPRIRRVR